MSALDALNADFHALVAKAEELGHTGLDELRSVWAKLTGHAHELQAEAIADGEQLVHDAEQAAAPVVAETESDATKLASEATADITQATQP